jgi:hypothetical protein
MFQFRPRLVLRILAGLAILVALQLLINADELWRFYFANPTRTLGVRVLEKAPNAPAAPRVAHDFDGDGVPDMAEVEYCNLSPLFDAGTSGLLRVHSGKDGTELLAFPTATPLDSAEWAGDLDGNGTDDILVANSVRPFYLLHTP